MITVQAKLQTVDTLEVADDPRLSRETKAFLKELNSGGVALETFTPLEARQVLVDAHDFGLLNGLAELPATRFVSPFSGAAGNASLAEMHWRGVMPLCPFAGSPRRAMSEIQTVQNKHDLSDGEFLPLPPLYCHQRQAKPCIRAVRGGKRSGYAHLFSLSFSTALIGLR